MIGAWPVIPAAITPLDKAKGVSEPDQPLTPSIVKYSLLLVPVFLFDDLFSHFSEVCPWKSLKKKKKVGNFQTCLSENDFLYLHIGFVAEESII